MQRRRVAAWEDSHPAPDDGNDVRLRRLGYGR